MWKCVSEAAGLLTGSVLTGSGVDQVGSKSGRPFIGSGHKSMSGSDRVRDDVSMMSSSGLTGSKTDRVRDDISMTSACGLTGSKTDRVRDWVGHAYWVKLTSA